MPGSLINSPKQEQEGSGSERKMLAGGSIYVLGTGKPGDRKPLPQPR